MIAAIFGFCKEHVKTIRRTAAKGEGRAMSRRQRSSSGRPRGSSCDSLGRAGRSGALGRFLQATPRNTLASRDAGRRRGSRPADGATRSLGRNARGGSQDPEGAFPATYSWLGVKRYTYDTAHHCSPTISTSAPTCCSSEIVTSESRHSAESSSRARPLPIAACRAVVTDLQLRLRLRGLPLRPAVWYRHDCKHDMERESRRQAIHDVLGASSRGRRTSTW